MQKQNISDEPTQRLLLCFGNILEAEMGHAIVLVGLGRLLGTSRAGEAAVWCLRDGETSPGLQLETPPDGAGRHDGWTEVRMDERLVGGKKNENPRSGIRSGSGILRHPPGLFLPNSSAGSTFSYRRASTTLSRIEYGMIIFCAR